MDDREHLIQICPIISVELQQRPLLSWILYFLGREHFHQFFDSPRLLTLGFLLTDLLNVRLGDRRSLVAPAVADVIQESRHDAVIRGHRTRGRFHGDLVIFVDRSVHFSGETVEDDADADSLVAEDPGDPARGGAKVPPFSKAVPMPFRAWQYMQNP